MSALIFRLRHVPDDEAHAIRELLDANGIDWYETSAGNWGIAMPGIWVSNDNQAPAARALIDQYQQERTVKQRELHEQEKRRGHDKTLKKMLFDRPFQSMGLIGFSLFILYVSVQPFLQLIGLSQQ